MTIAEQLEELGRRKGFRQGRHEGRLRGGKKDKKPRRFASPVKCYAVGWTKLSCSVSLV
jgi:fructose 1,6-bisphosphatase